MLITRTWMFASRLSKFLLLLTMTICVGCSSRANMEVLEAHIRNQESLMAKYENQLKRMESDLTVAQRESDILRNQLAENSNQQLFQETTQSLAAVEGLKFHEMLTAGQSEDEEPGDERLHAVIYPHDQHGELVKLSGTLEVEAIDLSQPHEDRVVGRWTYSPDDARQLWYSGFLTNGYQLDVPWSKTPRGEKVLLHAKLTTLDGRQFAATHTVSIEVPPMAKLDHPPLDLLTPPVQQAGGIQQLSNDVIVNEQPVGQRPDDGIAWQDRKVPRPAPLEPASVSGSSISEKASEPGRIHLPDHTEQLPAQKKSTQEPKPFPNGLQTSDNWTDATIPVLR